MKFRIKENRSIGDGSTKPFKVQVRAWDWTFFFPCPYWEDYILPSYFGRFKGGKAMFDNIKGAREFIKREKVRIAIHDIRLKEEAKRTRPIYHQP